MIEGEIMSKMSLITCLAVFLAGCAAVPVAPSPAADVAAKTLAVPSATETAPTSTPSPFPVTVTPEPQPLSLPAEPQRVEFQTKDGVNLVGYYYPAAVAPAPVVVLMHWAGGDQTDWLQVGMVAWLQNRGAGIPAASGTKAFDTPYPFTPLPGDLSLGVFTFDFRGYGESCGERQWAEHVSDARAAYRTAAGLEGVDPEKVAGIGASIGSDAVVDGCEICDGSLSLSPGSFLSVPYPQAVQALDGAGIPVWCVAAQDDPSAAAQTCNSAGGDHYRKQVYSSGGHAMELFRASKDLQPRIDEVLLDFLTEALDLP